MLKYFSLIYIISLFFNIAHANEQKIAIVVNNDIVTDQELHERCTLITLINHLHNLSASQQEELKQAAGQSLIEEELLKQQAHKFGIEFSAEEIQSVISSIEQENKMSKGHFARWLKAEKVYDSFEKKVKGDLIRQKFSTEIFSRRIQILPNEISNEAIKGSRVDLNLKIRQFISVDNSKASYENLVNLRTKIKDCNQAVKLPNNIKMQEQAHKLSSLSVSEQGLLRDIFPNQFSAVVTNANRTTMYQVCERKVLGLGEKESEILTSFLGRKKLSYEMLRFIAMIRNKAYIKIL